MAEAGYDSTRPRCERQGSAVVSVVLERLGASLDVFGEPILIDDEPAQAFVRIYSAAEARLYLEEAVITAAARPIRGFLVAADTVVAIGNAMVASSDKMRAEMPSSATLGCPSRWMCTVS